MTDSIWTEVETALPTDDAVVKTKVDDVMGLRRTVDLQMIDGKWTDPETGEPIAYQPTHWKVK